VAHFQSATASYRLNYYYYYRAPAWDGGPYVRKAPLPPQREGGWDWNVIPPPRYN
jgi:hypothetical protein